MELYKKQRDLRNGVVQRLFKTTVLVQFRLYASLPITFDLSLFLSVLLFGKRRRKYFVLENCSFFFCVLSFPFRMFSLSTGKKKKKTICFNLTENRDMTQLTPFQDRGKKRILVQPDLATSGPIASVRVGELQLAKILSQPSVGTPSSRSGMANGT